MRAVTVARRPCQEKSTTENVTTHEAGALNIDRTRIPYQSEEDKTPTVGSGTFVPEKGAGRGFPVHKDSWGQWSVNHQGRWPSNVVLQHSSRCHRRGTETIPGYKINRWKDGAKPFGDGAGLEYETEVFPDEEVQIWECSPSCPTRRIGRFAQDASMVSRFFKQVQETDMERFPEELIEYLTLLISPPPACDPVVLVAFDLEAVNWASYEDASVHGMLLQGNPDKHMEEVDRVLRPGGHVLVMAPDDEPTGHTGACAVEDFGYEIRDAILVLDEAEGFHYVAKASSAERNDGVSPTTLKNGKVVFNYHPTVKPVGVMQALLENVSKGCLVVDPFMGSGTTALACLRTGHNFVGIDLEEDHVRIATERVQHWDSVTCSWDAAEIVSEFKIEHEEEEVVDMGDFFGM